MPLDLHYLEGKKFCLVLVKADGPDPENGKIQLKCVIGRASINKREQLYVEHSSGRFQVPSSCYNLILPNDGTEMLQDAEYFTFCRVSGLEL